MKIKFLKPLAIAVLFAGLVAGCINDDNYGVPQADCVEPNLTANKSVADVVAMATGNPTEYVSSSDDIIEGYVTSSDERGNFFKSVSMQTMPTDGSQPIGFSVAIDDTSLFGKKYKPGNKVYIKLNGLYFAKVNGSLIIGALYINNGQQTVGRISQFDYASKVIPSCTSVNEDELVTPMTIAQAKSDSALNRLIEIDDVQFAIGEVGQPYYDVANDLGGATNRTLTDLFGGSVIFRTSSFANFSGNPIPVTSGKVRGVMTKFGSDYQFMARAESDIQLTNPRMAPLTPLFDEPFTTNFPAWSKINVTGAQVWTTDTTHGNPGTCAKMSGFASGNNTNEDWLISPAISLSGLTNAILTFDTATDFAGNVLQPYISTDYTGSGAPSAATWTPLSGTLAPTDSNFVWTGSGAVNISSYVGSTVYIAFKYTSTTSASATWEVDNVKIVGN